MARNSFLARAPTCLREFCVINTATEIEIPYFSLGFPRNHFESWNSFLLPLELFYLLLAHPHKTKCYEAETLVFTARFHTNRVVDAMSSLCLLAPIFGPNPLNSPYINFTQYPVISNSYVLTKHAAELSKRTEMYLRPPFWTQECVTYSARMRRCWSCWVEIFAVFLVLIPPINLNLDFIFLSSV